MFQEREQDWKGRTIDTVLQSGETALYAGSVVLPGPLTAQVRFGLAPIRI